MGTETIKKQIERENEDKSAIARVLDECRSEIVQQIKPFMREKLENIVLDEIKQKPEYTKELGIDSLRKMKQQLTMLVEQSDELVDSVFTKDEVWFHINYLMTPNDNLYGDKWANKREADKRIDNGIRKVLGNSGKILADYGYVKVGAKNVRTCQWQQEDDNEIVYGSNYALSLPDILENKIQEYCNEIGNLYDSIKKINKLEQELSKQEAMDLWEKA